MNRLWLCALLPAALLPAVVAGCSPLPGTGSVARGTTAALDYPAILPLEGLLVQAASSNTQPQTLLAARAAALQARAAALRNTP